MARAGAVERFDSAMRRLIGGPVREKCRECGSRRRESPLVHWDESAKVGGCMFCSRWVNHAGGVAHKVLVVQSARAGFVARACEMCVDDLVGAVGNRVARRD